MRKTKIICTIGPASEDVYKRQDLNRLSAITHLTMHSLSIMPILEQTCCLRKDLSTHM